MYMQAFPSGLNVRLLGGLLLAGVVFVSAAQARSNIRDAFFANYPAAETTVIGTVPSHPDHCGVCHYDFGGSGPRNPYGIRLGEVIGNFKSNPSGRQAAVASIENEDPDNDGYTTLEEVTDTVTYANTPTFPGLTASNYTQTIQVTHSELQPHLTPVTGNDNTPPAVTISYPNGGEIVLGNGTETIHWSIVDESPIASIDIDLSYDGGVTYDPVARGLSGIDTYTWHPPNRPTTQALIRVTALDTALNSGNDESDAVFEIAAPAGGIAPTTLRDFDMPGSQPFDAGTISPPSDCATCHGNYDQNVEPYHNWQGSMMAHSGRDKLMEATLAIAQQDAPDSGDLCLRCHLPNGWLQGRSVPTDGSAMIAADRAGVSCGFCHRLVDPFYDPLENPIEDDAILAGLDNVPANVANGMYIVDPSGSRRGPFVDATSGHAILVSPFHTEAALCGTCHDVSNPAFEKDPNGDYVPNAFDTSASDFSSHVIAPVERTYSEWFYSDYNTPAGVYAPEFGGNKDYVASCQDCHMRDVTGEGCNLNPPTRTDLPLHDMTGGSTWYPSLLPTLYPGEVDQAAIDAGIVRARYMLQNAADMTAVQDGAQLKVTITNNTGHKLPTGYPEGRRMWLNIQFFDDQGQLVGESAAYDPNSGVLDKTGDAKIYEIKPGLDETTAPLAGQDPGESFHFVLNNAVFKDNRIPPRGFTNADYASFGGPPVAYSYPDGQYWDDTYYGVPEYAVSATVSLYYQSTSKEFVEFLRDKNTTNTKGQELYDLWNNNGKCPPELMQQVTLAVTPPVEGDCNGDGLLDTVDLWLMLDCLSGPGSTAGCGCGDWDNDGDVDIDDVELFSLALSS